MFSKKTKNNSKNDKKTTFTQKKSKTKQSFKINKTNIELLKILEKSKKNLLFWGFQATKAAILNPNRKVLNIFISKNFEEKLKEIYNNLSPIRRSELPVYKVINNLEMNFLIDREANYNTNHQGIIISVLPQKDCTIEEIIKKFENKPNKKFRLLILDQVTDIGNIGSITRSAYAFEIDAILITKRLFLNENGSFAKTAAGSNEYIPFVRVTNLARSIKKLKDAGLIIVGLEKKGSSTLSEVKNNKQIGIILGAEDKGMRRLTKELCDYLVSIKINKKCESLNVSIAASIAMYETYN